jgi:stage III sporulation protein AE
VRVAGARGGVAAGVLALLLLAGAGRVAAAAPGGSASAVAGAGTPAGPSPAELAQQELGNLDTSAIAQYLEALGQELPGSGLGRSTLGDVLRGGGVLRHPGQILQALGGVFVGELRRSAGLLGRLLVLVVFAAVVRQIQAAFAAEAVGRVADAAVFLALGALCLAGFDLAADLARRAVTDLSSFMVALLPALVGLLAASGAVTTAGLLQPAMVGAVNAVGLVVRAVVFPLALLGALLDLVGAFAPSFRLSSLSGLLRQVATGVLGLCLTAFLGLVAVEGAAGSVADGVALRTGKYVVRTFVPVVGGLLADTAELILTSGWLLRSGLGLVGLLAVVLLVAVPVLKMLALWMIYRLAAAAAQPVGGDGVAQVLAGIGGALALLTTAVAAVGLMCFLSLTVLVGASGAALAGR